MNIFEYIEQLKSDANVQFFESCEEELYILNVKKNNKQIVDYKIIKCKCENCYRTKRRYYQILKNKMS
jgi:hypothetical protein